MHVFRTQKTSFLFETGLSVVLAGLELTGRLPHLLSAGIKGVLHYTGSPETVFVELLLHPLVGSGGGTQVCGQHFHLLQSRWPGYTCYYWGTTGKMLVFPEASSN